MLYIIVSHQTQCQGTPMYRKYQTVPGDSGDLVLPRAAVIKYGSSVLIRKRLLSFTLANFELIGLFNQGCGVRIKHSECCLESLQFASKVILDSERLEKGNKDELSCKTYIGMKFEAKHFLHCFLQQKSSSLPVFMMLCRKRSS